MRRRRENYRNEGEEEGITIEMRRRSRRRKENKRNEEEEEEGKQ